MNQFSTAPVTPDSAAALTQRYSGTGSGSDLKQAAQDFEALFVSMMLKTMRESMSGDMFAGDSSDTFGGMFDSFMGQHIAQNGGLGLTQLFQSVPAAAVDSIKSAISAHSHTADQTDSRRHMEAYENAIAIGQ